MRQTPKLEPYAILVADMIGYSQRLAQHPIDTHTSFTSHLNDIFAPIIQKYRGRIVKTTGDGIVAIFRDCAEAEGSAREIQFQMKARDGRSPALAPIKYRIAIHYGRIVVESRDIFGIDVNTAIHMQRLASPGGICLSSALFFRLPEASKKPYRFLGEKYLKNIPDPVGVHTDGPSHSSMDQAPSDDLPMPRRRYLSAPARLGILDLRVLADDGSRSVFADIAHESLTHGLSRFDSLLTIIPVPARAGPKLSERAESLPLLSNELACEYLLHGSCIIGPRTLQLTVHLQSLVKRELIWSGKIKIDLEQLDVLDELITAELIAPVVLYLERSKADSCGVAKHSEDETLFLEAKRLMARRTLASFDQARHLLSMLADRCGEVGDLYIALARVEHSRGLLLAGEQFVDSLEQAWAHAKKAIEIDELNPHAHAELALQEMFLKRQSYAAEIYQSALKLNPYDAMVRADWADCLVNMGRAGEAAPILEQILAGWPRDRAWVEWNLCDAYWALDRPDRIVALLDRHPDQPHVHRNLAASYAKLGRMPEAKRHAERVRQHQPGFSSRVWSEVMPNTNKSNAEEFVEHLERAGL